jgi:alanine racemase
MSVASWIELDAAALQHNAKVLRGLVGPGVAFGAVLKGNAYGHGFDQVLPIVHGHADLLYVIEPRDALRVRAWEAASGAPERQVLVIGAVAPDEAVELARARVEAVISDPGGAALVTALRAARIDQPLRVHLHIDTGLGREGFTLDRLPADAAFLTDARDVVAVTGLMSHFANTEDVTEQTYATAQLSGLAEAEKRLADVLSGAQLQRHIAASAAAMLLPPARKNAVRAGISLYGLWPSSETRLSARAVLGVIPELRPVLSWRCPSQALKWLPSGSYVGYGCTYRCPAETRIAVLPVGYYDGYPRLLSGRAHVLVNGHRCAVLGRVMMNHVVVDVTRAAPQGAEVRATLLGRDGEELIGADQLAGWAQTINYEIVTRIGPHLRRVVV